MLFQNLILMLKNSLNGGDKIMKKQCPECKRVLELNEKNFRFFNGYWRRKCRQCQNAHKRKVYQNIKHTRPKLTRHAAYKLLKEKRIAVYIERFEHEESILRRYRLNLNSPA